MRKYQFSFLLFLFSTTISFAQQPEEKVLTDSDYDHAAQFLGFNTQGLVYHSGVNPQWQEDHSLWYSVNTKEGRQFVWVDPASGKTKTASNKATLLGEKPSESGRSARRSWDTIVSPDETKAVYIKDWNLWMKNKKTGKETQLTKDGVENYGYATDNAGWKHSNRPIVLWSPDSKKIATFQQDQRHVSDMYLVETKVGAPKLHTWKYPIPQDSAIVQIERVIIDVEQPKIIRLKVPGDPHRGTLCDDIACDGSFGDNQWSEDSRKLAFVSTSRDHKIEKLRVANAETGAVKEIFTDEVPTQYESGQGTANWRYFFNKDEFLWYSEKDNWGHLYLYDAQTGKLKNRITQGDFVVTRLLHVDKKNEVLYFMANGYNKDEDPYFAHFYRVDFSGKNFKALSPELGNHRISLSPGTKYFVDTYSQPDVPPVSVLKNTNGKTIKKLEKADISDLTATGWNPPKPIKVKSRDGKWDLYGLMYLPTDLDENKKYPVVNYIYPGPQGGGVGNRSFYTSRGDHQAMAELGFVVVVIDGTCNPGRSKDFHDSCYGNMADNTLPDQISGLKQLAKKYPYLDLERVGIWGHSGGGFATVAALFRYPDFYKVGISESGNHDNRNYEDDWGERYIGLLTTDEQGKSNYEEQSNQNFAEGLKGKLLLAHGGMDDNVPPYNTYLVIEALIKANKDFDLIIFPNAHHGYGADSYYMMRRRWDYFVKNLMGATPPENYKIEPHWKTR